MRQLKPVARRRREASINYVRGAMSEMMRALRRCCRSPIALKMRDSCDDVSAIGVVCEINRPTSRAGNRAAKIEGVADDDADWREESSGT